MSARTFMLGAAIALFAVGAQASPPSGAAAPVSSRGPAADASPSARGDAFVLLGSDSQGVEMSGSMDDLGRARSLRAGSEALLYVRQGGSAYVIRDAATLRRAKALFEPQQALGRQQAELGTRQAALGRQQAQLGAAQAHLALRQVGDSPSEAEGRARQQEALSQQQSDLGIQQAALGRQQAELGRQQSDRGHIADKQMQTLFGEALRSGLAQRID